MNQAPHVAPKKQHIFSTNEIFQIQTSPTTPYTLTQPWMVAFPEAFITIFTENCKNAPCWTTEPLGSVWVRLRSVTVAVFLATLSSYRYYLWIRWQTVDGSSCCCCLFFGVQSFTKESDPQISATSWNHTLHFHLKISSQKNPFVYFCQFLLPWSQLFFLFYRHPI